MKNFFEIKEEMRKTEKQINKIKQMKNPQNSITFLRGFLTGLKWVLKGDKS